MRGAAATLAWCSIASAARAVIDALVFDFDGLIIDTEWCEYRSICDQFLEAIASRGATHEPPTQTTFGRAR